MTFTTKADLVLSNRPVLRKRGMSDGTKVNEEAYFSLYAEDKNGLFFLFGGSLTVMGAMNSASLKIGGNGKYLSVVVLRIWYRRGDSSATPSGPFRREDLPGVVVITVTR